MSGNHNASDATPDDRALPVLRADFWAKRSVTCQKLFNFPRKSDVSRTYARIARKPDGSLVTLYWHDGQWKETSDAYDAALLLRNSWGPQQALNVALSGAAPDFISRFPEFRTQILEIGRRALRMTGSLDAQYAELKDLPDQKTYALAARKYGNSGALFQLRQGKVSSAYRERVWAESPQIYLWDAEPRPPRGRRSERSMLNRKPEVTLEHQA